MKYIAYCRKSTDEPDRQILSIEAQIAEVKEFAIKEGLEIVEFITESKGEKYYFCSENCRKSFDKEPEKYVIRENIPAKSCCQQNTKSLAKDKATL